MSKICNYLKSVFECNKIPASWESGEVANMFRWLSTKWYEKYGEFPDWFPKEAPNFDNMIMPKHKNLYMDSSAFRVDVNPSDNWNTILWIYENIKGDWDYEWSDAKQLHIYYFNNKDDAAMFKLVWG